LLNNAVMNEEDKGPNYKTFTDKDLVKILAYLFVLAIYGVVFMKILFLD